MSEGWWGGGEKDSLFPKPGFECCFKRGVSSLLIFLSGQGLENSTDKKTKHSTTNIKPLFFQQFYNTCQIDFPVSLCSFYASVV